MRRNVLRTYVFEEFSKVRSVEALASFGLFFLFVLFGPQFLALVAPIPA